MTAGAGRRSALVHPHRRRELNLTPWIAIVLMIVTSTIAIVDLYVLATAILY